MKTKQRLNRKNILRSSLLLLSIIFICRINSVNAQPVITSINPSSGSAGTPVILTGTNFNTTASNNIVYFGATKAIVVSATATLLNVTVPLGATYQPVSVTNAANGLTGYSTQFFMPTFACGDALATSSFATPVSFVTENNPYNLNSGDLDGDGKIDIAVANYVSNTISLYRNISSGGLLALDIPTNVTTENGPTCIAVGDLNGDGKPDLAVINYNSNVLSVYKNNSTTGVISFEPKIDYPTGNTPLNVVIIDSDSDGKPDLAATNSNSSSNTISIYKNNSSINSISFDPKIDFATGDTPLGIATGDINSDGKTDIAVANYFSNTISVFNNTSSIGNISFAAKVDFASGPYPLDLAVGDMNGDLKPDITITNYIDNYVSVYQNNGSGGSISFAPYTTYATGSGPWGIAISDLNGDTKPDIGAACLWTPCVSVFENNSNATAVSFVSAINFSAGTTSREISIADYNSDGKPDMAIVNYDENTVKIYENTNGGIAPAAAGPISGLSTICQGQNAVIYSTPAITNADSHVWTLPTGASGNSITNSITVNYGNSAVSGDITVAGANNCGFGVASALSIIVNPTPPTAVITNIGNNVLQSSSPDGNQWYNQAGIIAGATSQNYVVTENGSYYVIVTLTGCSSEQSNTIQIINTDLVPEIENKISLYPNPFTEAFTIETEGFSNKIEIEVFNSLGQIVLQDKFDSKININTELLLPGIYTVKITTEKLVRLFKVIKK